MIILNERLTWNEANIISEGGGIDSTTGKPKDLYMSGIFIQGNVRNHNQRVYPLDEIRNAVEQVQRSIQNNETVYGEADHPDGLTINVDRISHMITDLRMDGQNGIGKLKIIPTPMGQICKTLIENGGKLGVSSRGSGNVNESTGEVKGFEIVTVDIVVRPSAPNAYPQPIYEKQFRDIFNSKNGNELYKLSSNAYQDSIAQKYLAQQLKSWINDLKRS